MSADDPTVSPTETEPALPKVVRVALDKLVLDPNNPRIMDRIKPWPVPRERWADVGVQREVARAIRGPMAEDVVDLVVSIGTVGWHEVSLIQVSPIGNGQYLVLNGNRRVVALRLIQEENPSEDLDLNFDAMLTMGSLPVLVVEERPDVTSLIERSLGHIVGHDEWRSQNEAMIFKYLREEQKFTDEKLAYAFIQTEVMVRASINALHLLGTQIDEVGHQSLSGDSHLLLKRAMALRPFRIWLGWNPAEGRCENVENTRRLIGWLVRLPVEVSVDPEDGRPLRARKLGDPLLASSDIVRQVARFLHSPARLDLWERQRLAELQDADPVQRDALAAESAVLSVRSSISTLQSLQASITVEQLAEIERLAEALRGIVAANQGDEALPENTLPWEHHVTGDVAHLQNLTLTRYRSLVGLNIEGLNRINLIVGANNSGKTSVLEAVSLLIHQSDPRALLSSLRRRARWDVTTNPEWLAHELPAPAEVRARFGGGNLREGVWMLTFSTTAEHPLDDRYSTLGTATTVARFGDDEQQSTMVLRVGHPPRLTGRGERRWICPTMFHSPFSASDPESIQRAHEQSVILRIKERLLELLREHVDDKLIDIELVENHRFRVTHKVRPNSPDLSSFGDGLQRAFQIGLHLAAAAGGVLLIDELENALYTSLLIPFTRLIQELAVEFNVQVFITTHSKETVDAFLFNDYRAEDIVAFGLPARGSGHGVKRYGGPGLRDVVEGLDLDIRRV